jgi:anti-sigma-K factor RskA
MTDPTSAPNPNDVDSLLGAYALDALDADDRARVETYLERDASARTEVDEMRETAASLALLPESPMEAPPELWSRIAEAITSDRAAAGSSAAVEPTDELAARRARRLRVSWTATAAVAAAIAVVVLAAQVASLHGQLDRSREVGTAATAAAFERAAKVHGAREVGLRSSSGATLARLVLLPDGAGYLRGDHLEPLGSHRTYQLWALTGAASSPTAISAGVLGRDPSAVSFHASGPVLGFAVTVENAGGVVKSHNPAIASAQLS